MAGGVRVYEPPAGHPDTEQVEARPIDYGAGDIRQRQIIEVANAEQETTTGHAVYGTLEAVLPASTVDLVALVVPEGYRLYGFSATGTGDAHFTLFVNEVPVLSDRIDHQRKSCQLFAPRALPVVVGTAVRLQVFNETPGTRAYEATLFGEVTVDA